jgi:hypothetical protein
MRPNFLRVARRRLATLDSRLEDEILEKVREVFSKTFREMKTFYRRWFNTQKVEGKAFEGFLEQVLPQYDASTRTFYGDLDSTWIPYVGGVEFAREDLSEVRELVRHAVFEVLAEYYGEPLGMSNAFHWDTETEEEFWILGRGYDVRAAKRILVARPRVVERMALEGLNGLAGRTLGMNPDSSAVDLRLPILVVTTPSGNLLPIDGWNRIRKALASNAEDVPAVFFNAAETRRVALNPDSRRRT